MFAVLVMVRAGIRTVTLVEQAAGAVPEAGQLLPGTVEVRVSARVLLPVSGLFTVTEKVIVADCPGSRSPFQDRSGVVDVTRPSLAAASLLKVASSRTSVSGMENTMSVSGTWPLLVTVMV